MQLTVPAVLVLLLVCLLPEAAPAQTGPPVVGAIRWDAWCGGGVTDEVTAALTPPRYHFRLPWFAEVLAGGAVRIAGGRQEIMDQEITYAAAAGLDYWAFVMYRDGDQMSRGIELYLQSKLRDRVRFCLILHNNLGVPEANWPTERDRVLRLLQEPTYVRVCGDRPLVYMYIPNNPPRQRLAELQAAVSAVGLKPYYVLMGWNPRADWQAAQELGFDAVSAYACGGDGSFAGLAARAKSVQWEATGQVGCPMIPLVTTGWDRRPRIDRPPPWERDNKSTAWVETATPQELAAHLADALQWTRDHQALTPAQTLLIYAWNEHDEGGWLCPTWRADGVPDTGRLEALKEVLRDG